MKNRLAYHCLRISLGIVFLAFGFGKFNPNNVWVQTIRAMPWFEMLGSFTFIVYLIGALEILFGLSFILNKQVKDAAALASLELITIIIMLKLGEIRDVGLLGGTLALFLLDSQEIKRDK